MRLLCFGQFHSEGEKTKILFLRIFMDTGLLGDLDHRDEQAEVCLCILKRVAMGV